MTRIFFALWRNQDLFCHGLEGARNDVNLFAFGFDKDLLCDHFVGGRHGLFAEAFWAHQDFRPF